MTLDEYKGFREGDQVEDPEYGAYFEISDIYENHDGTVDVELRWTDYKVITGEELEQYKKVTSGR